MTPKQWARMLRVKSANLPEQLEQALTTTLVSAVRLAKGKIGYKQEDWETLAKITKYEKGKLGFEPPEYSPLLRKGELLASFFYTQERLSGEFGSLDEVLFWHEFGTARMPPRPVVGPSTDEAAQVLQVRLQLVAQKLKVAE